MVLSLSYRKPIRLTPFEPFVWRGLLWHTGRSLPGHTPYDVNAILISGVSAGGSQFVKVSGISQLDSDTLLAGKSGAYCVVENYLYVRLRHTVELPAFASAQEWLFANIVIAVDIFVSDNEFRVENGKNIRYALTSTYSSKMSAEPHDYATLKFNSFKLSFLRSRYQKDPSDLLGNLVSFYSDDMATRYETMWAENVTYDFDTVNLSCKDMRSRMTDMVIDQQFEREKYINGNGNMVMDNDVAKRYKADAVGYCSSVPGDCLNGVAFDSESYRKYRFGYGTVEVDYAYNENSPDNKGVEVEIENGWRVLQRGSAGGINNYWTETVTETLPSGVLINTTLVCVPNLVVHPPREGYDIPDLEATPRGLRVTGWFHTERGRDAMTRPREILKYFLERYCSLPYIDLYFNIPEINAELAVLDNAPCGIYLDKPEKLFNVIGKLQNGSIYGWQFTQYRGLMTARVDNPDRAVSWNIKAADILNISELVIDCDGANYVTDSVIGYARNYSEDTAKEYTDYGKAQEVLNIRGVPKSKTVDTLLKEESDAKIRHAEETRDSMKIARSVKGIKLFGKKWEDMRPYDTLTADISIPGGAALIAGEFKITNLDINRKMSIITLDIKESA